MDRHFAERSNDSRYDKTFQTVWIANTANVTNTPTTAGNTRGIGYTLAVGSVDTAVWMPPYGSGWLPSVQRSDAVPWDNHPTQPAKQRLFPCCQEILGLDPAFSEF